MAICTQFNVGREKRNHMGIGRSVNIGPANVVETTKQGYHQEASCREESDFVFLVYSLLYYSDKWIEVELPPVSI